MIATPFEQESKEIINDIHTLLDHFIDPIGFHHLAGEEEVPFLPAMLNEAYVDNEPEYTAKDLIWKNPKYDPTR
jgi:hypothetical protein